MHRFTLITFTAVLSAAQLISALKEGAAYLQLPAARTVSGAGNNCGFRGDLENGDDADTCDRLQRDSPGTNCGVCGDDIRQATPRSHEMGRQGLNTSPRIVYRQGSNVTLKVVIPNPQGGAVSFRACCSSPIEMDLNVTIAQKCFDANFLAINAFESPADQFLALANGELKVASDRPYHQYLFATVTTMLDVDPAEHCTLQFNYRTGRHAPNGKVLVKQETFRSCSDIRVLPKTDFTYLLNKKFKKCLTNQQGVIPLTNNLKLEDCRAGSLTSPQSVVALQGWNEFSTTQNGIMFESNSLCLDVRQASKSAGAAVIQWECKGAANQQWTTVPVANDAGSFQIKNKNSGKCLSANSNSKVDISQQDCGQKGAIDDAQIWKFQSSTLYGA